MNQEQQPPSAVPYFFLYSYGDHRHLHSFPTRRSSDLNQNPPLVAGYWVFVLGKTGDDMLRFYFEVARTAYRRQLIYRWANLAGLLTNIFFGAIFSYVMIALFHARPVAAGFNVRDALRYIWLLQAMVMVVLTFGWYDLMLTIRSG